MLNFFCKLFVEELHFIYTASALVIGQLVDASLKKYNCAVGEVIVNEMVEELCKSHPASKGTGSRCALWFCV